MRMLTAGIGAPEKLPSLPARNSRLVRGTRAAVSNNARGGLQLTIGMSDCGRGRGKRRRREGECDVNVKEEEEEEDDGWRDEMANTLDGLPDGQLSRQAERYLRLTILDRRCLVGAC